MLKTYFTVAYRNILKNKLFSGITIFGLSIGIAVCLTIVLIVHYELSFNNGFKDIDRTYRVYSVFSGTFSATNCGVPVPAGEYAEQNLTGFENITYFFTREFSVLAQRSNGEVSKITKNEKIALVNSSYFEVFNDYDWVVGSASTALSEPFGAVLTVSQAKLYFGDDIDPVSLIDKELIYSDSLRVLIRGIVSDLSFTTDFNFTDFISYSTIEHSWLKNMNTYNSWGNTGSDFQLFVKLPESTKVEEFEKNLKILNVQVEEANPNENFKSTFDLQPMPEIHSGKIGIFNHSPQSIDLEVLKIISLIGLLILVLAIINFVNLETAQSSTRSKEIGVRKVLGSSKIDIAKQYFAQCLLLSIVAALVSLPIIQIAFHTLEDMLPEGLRLNLGDLYIWSYLLGISVLTGLLAGIYPALILSKIQPVQALKKKVFTSKGVNLSVLLRQTLTVFQFGIAQILLTFTLAGILQLDKLTNAQLGFDTANRMHVYMPWSSTPQKQAQFVQQLRSQVDYQQITTYSNYPSRSGTNTNILNYKTDSVDIATMIHWTEADLPYFDYFGLSLEEGRLFIPSDSLQELVVNRAFMDAHGFKTLDDIQIGGFKETQIVGVLENYHFQSLHHEINPLAIKYISANTGVGMLLSNDAISKQKVLEHIRTLWQKTFGDVEFNSVYIENSVANQYRSENKMAKLIQIATTLAIIISCLGLFGLASFTVSQRTKEIGMRKVLGASPYQIVALVTIDFLKLVLVAFLVCLPVSYYYTNIWLDDFTVKISIGPTIYGSILGLTLLVATSTLIYHIITIIKANPIEALRYE